MTFLDVCLCIGAIIVAPRLLALAAVPSRMRRARRERETERFE